jgi:hypothetical protein
MRWAPIEPKDKKAPQTKPMAQDQKKRRMERKRLVLR